MPRRIRYQDPEAVYHITNRADQCMFLLRPDDDLNEIVMTWLRRAARIHDVELYAVVIMCNHFHLIARASKMNLSNFMCYFQTSVSREVNNLRNRSEARVFPKRFSSEPILDNESFIEKLRYVLLNPVKANLVEFPGQFPGYTSWHQHVAEPQPLRHRAVPPEIVVPPFWKHLKPAELEKKWRNLVQPGVIEYAQNRSKPVVGAQRLRKLNWRKRPRRTKQNRRKPLCHSKNRSTWQKYARHFSHVQSEYRAASAQWRAGKAVEFPFGTIPPGWTRCDCNSERKYPPEFRCGSEKVLSVAA